MFGRGISTPIGLKVTFPKYVLVLVHQSSYILILTRCNVPRISARLPLSRRNRKLMGITTERKRLGIKRLWWRRHFSGDPR